MDPESKTETFVAGKVIIDSDKWRDVPVHIRTGKRMKQKTSADRCFMEKNGSGAL
ncbi:MAG: hypothetical protein U5K84_11515 [Alkalibacterium sp.]|nr:hypothetical protein [Alkalibacterium sp.]